MTLAELKFTASAFVDSPVEGCRVKKRSLKKDCPLQDCVVSILEHIKKNPKSHYNRYLILHKKADGSLVSVFEIPLFTVYRLKETLPSTNEEEFLFICKSALDMICKEEEPPSLKRAEFRRLSRTIPGLRTPPMEELARRAYVSHIN